MEYPQTWNTDAAKLAEVAADFEAKLPGWWWSVGMCSVGAHASCAVDGNGAAKHLLDGITAGQLFDAGFHEDTFMGKPHEALQSVLEQALGFLATFKPALQVARKDNVMGMFHNCEFPVYKDGRTVQKSYVIRDERYEDIIHDFVKSGTKLMVEDWDTKNYENVVLQKQGCVWVLTDLKDGPTALPESYYEFADTFKKNRMHAARSHPFL